MHQCPNRNQAHYWKRILRIKCIYKSSIIENKITSHAAICWNASDSKHESNETGLLSHLPHCNAVWVYEHKNSREFENIIEYWNPTQTALRYLHTRPFPILHGKMFMHQCPNQNQSHYWKRILRMKCIYKLSIIKNSPSIISYFLHMRCHFFLLGGGGGMFMADKYPK